MIKKLQCLFIMVSIVVISACGKQFSSPTLLDEIAGVWRAGGDGAMVTIIYADKKLSLLVNDHSIAVSPGEIDIENKTVNLNITTQDGKSGVWTIRQIWNAEKDAFTLQLTLHDGTQDDLAFVRKISTNDLNKLANSEAKNSPEAALDQPLNGTYERYEDGKPDSNAAEITLVVVKQGKVKITGNSTWVGNAETGNVNTGEIEGLAEIKANTIHFDNECKFDIKTSVDSLVVANEAGDCGGLNVSFQGIYKKANK